MEEKIYCSCPDPVLNADNHSQCIRCSHVFDLAKWTEATKTSRDKKLNEARRVHGFASLDQPVPFISRKGYGKRPDPYGPCPCFSGKKLKWCHGMAGLEAALKIGFEKIKTQQLGKAATPDESAKS